MQQQKWNGLYNLCWRTGKIESGFYTASRAIVAVKEEFPKLHEVENPFNKIVYLFQSRENWAQGERAIAQVTRMNQDPIW